ncbi:hypothetical protein R5R35_009552 [Gryllus longicercus]|uniref:gamma-glutamylcyclotransferase n=1 Tax=Gryllus longicercus TaxID=2509291 RepID=A0AAN9VK79_9ORTH
MGPLACAAGLLHALLAAWMGWPPSPSGHAAGAAVAGAMGGERFLYFAYGSNLLAERLRINNPSAERVAAARLDGYRLDFGYMSPRWGGHAATVVPQPGRVVWGAVWSVGQEHLDDLDRQEGVQSGVYVPIQVDVHSSDGRKLHCRSYHLQEQPPTPLPEGLLITEGRLPSKIYWQVIVQGARETGLPSDYIDFLEKIPHNDFMGNFSIGQLASNLHEINTPLDNK